MKKENNNAAVDANLKKRHLMDDKELERKIKDMTDEDLVRVFLAMLRRDKSRAEYLFQYIKEVVNSAAAMGSRHYQPIAMLTLYARQSEGMTEFKFRPARTGSEDVYRNLKLKRFFELVNDAWVQYGNEVFGGITEQTRMDMSSVAAWEKAVEEQKD
jgi:thioesterase domain-containing protein